MKGLGSGEVRSSTWPTLTDEAVTPGEEGPPPGVPDDVAEVGGVVDPVVPVDEQAARAVAETASRRRMTECREHDALRLPRQTAGCDALLFEPIMSLFLSWVGLDVCATGRPPSDGACARVLRRVARTSTSSTSERSVDQPMELLLGKGGNVGLPTCGEEDVFVHEH
jgi:hypothetical protein